MKQRALVSSIMTRDVFTVQIDEKLEDVLRTLRSKKIRHVPVLHAKQLVGIISKTDISRLTFSGLFAGEDEVDEAILNMLNISQVMTHKPRVVNESDTIKEVAKILASEEFHALPVVKDNDHSELAGIVTTTDVIKYLLEQY
ncbi:MAG TPA: CBS domain-containing protein [Cyclobacteriaceae bacterium]|nr:CBS domain-containing protein [Cyclobacteriaceae bacterium]